MRLLPRVLLTVCLATCGAAIGMTAGCADAATQIRLSLDIQGMSRTYMLFRPDGAGSSRRLPIVMMLHGGLGNGDRIAQQTGLPAYVDQRRFIAVFPDSGGEQWNDGRETTRSGRDDVAFLIAVVHEVAAKFGGDAGRVFVGGASNGGMMAQRLACEATSVFAAYAVAVANMPYGLAGNCRPSRRAPMIFFDAPTDPLMPWMGGEIRHGRFRGVGGRVLSTPETVDFWSRVDGCGGPRTQDLPDRANDGTHVRIHDFGSCGLILYEIDGGGHAWPGHDAAMGPLVELIVGRATHNIDATPIILDFFRRYGL